MIDELTPGLPAICGFGGAIDQLGQTGGFEAPIAANYSNAGCDVVGSTTTRKAPRRCPAAKASNGA